MITLDSDPAEELEARCITRMRFPVVGGKRIKKARELTLDIGHDDDGGKGGGQAVTRQSTSRSRLTGNTGHT